jgi:beta-glucosidase
MRDIRATARAMHHVLVSHGRSIEVMRGLGMGNLGAVFNLEGAIPQTDTEADRHAAAVRDAIYNRFFIQGVFHGSYPDLVLEGLEPHLPTGWQDDFKTITQPLDWLGLNYYTCARISAAPEAAWPHMTMGAPVPPLTQMEWEIHPDALHAFLKRTARDYSGDLPIHITENGMANPDQVDVPDTARIDYIESHLGAVRAAIADGVPVAGYYAWSLMDNYEWALGYEKRFGLVHVDFETLARTPKASYDALAQWWR